MCFSCPEKNTTWEGRPSFLPGLSKPQILKLGQVVNLSHRMVVRLNCHLGYKCSRELKVVFTHTIRMASQSKCSRLQVSPRELPVSTEITLL